MVILYLILIVLAVLILIAIILIQNPKGGGLSSELTGFSSQFLGVQRTTDILEKGTWVFVIILLFLCLTSTWFLPKGSISEQQTINKDENFLNNMNLKNNSVTDTTITPNTLNFIPQKMPVEKKEKHSDEKNKK